jgi:DNA-binding beta-propeller fold protein YncE
MHRSDRRRLVRFTPAAIVVVVAAALVDVPLRGVTAQQVAQPTNDLPNPYRTIVGWAKMPEGRTWGATSAVDIAKDGTSIWVAERCGDNSCVGSSLDPILEFDAGGNLIGSFGAGLLLSPHGIAVDPEGNVWVTDCACTGASLRDSTGRGHQVFKFSPEGKLLMTLGTKGGAKDPGYFYQPNDVLVAPNGDIFVAEGHGRGADRVLKFSPDGKLIKAWGRRGTGPGEFNQPHALAMDSRGRLFVGDRSNNRIQIFDQDGNFLEQWTQFSRPSGIYIDKDDNIYVADSESGSVASHGDAAHGAWKRGIRIGSAKDGSVRAFIPDPDENAKGTSAAEGVAVDARGNIYGAEVGPKDLKQYVRAPIR